MPHRIYDFKCSNNHTFERYTDASNLILLCADCGTNANRQLSAPLIPVGVMGAYWAADRAKKQLKEKV